MPYSIQTADDITIDGIPDTIAPDSQELRQRVAQVRLQRRMQSPEFQAARDAQVAADRDLYNPTRGMPLWEQALVNWGAGVGDTLMGARQLASKVGIGTGPTDEEIEEKRRIDQGLRDANAGAGLMQGLGAASPFFAIPGGAIARPVLGGLRMLPGVGRFVPELGTTTALVGSGAVGGAGAAAVTPKKSNETRDADMLLAAGIGAAIPAGGAAAPAIVRGGRKLLTEAGAQERAIDMLADHLGDGGKAVLDKLGTYKRPTLKGAPVDVPTTAAQATGDARLAQMEAYSRSRPGTQPNWADFDSAQNAGRYDVLQQMAPSELRMSRLERVRTGRTAPQREAALAQAAQAGNFAEPVLQHVDDLMRGEAGAIPAVESIGRYVQRTLGPDAAGEITPQRLYTVRKVLADKLGGKVMPGDELGAAAKSARAETMGVIKAIDDALDAASSGQWTPYLRDYANRSKPITSGRAMSDVVEKIETKPLKGTTPEITYAGIKTASKGTEGKYGDKLLPKTRTDLGNFMDSLKQAESASRTRKTAATMGGGSITNTDQMLAKLTTRVIESLPGVGGYAQRMTELNRDAVERHLARLLQSPTELGGALRALPERQRAQLVDETLRAAGMASAAESVR